MSCIGLDMHLTMTHDKPRESVLRGRASLGYGCAAQMHDHGSGPAEARLVGAIPILDGMPWMIHDGNCGVLPAHSRRAAVDASGGGYSVLAIPPCCAQAPGQCMGGLGDDGGAECGPMGRLAVWLGCG